MGPRYVTCLSVTINLSVEEVWAPFRDPLSLSPPPPRRHQ